MNITRGKNPRDFAIGEDAERTVQNTHWIARFARCIVTNDRSDFSTVLQFRLCITKLRMRVASNRLRFDSRRARIACELSETALYSSIRSRPSVAHACTRSQDKRPLCKREFHSARPMVDAVPVVSVLSRLRASVPRRDRSSLAARIDARRFELVLTGRAGYAKQGEGPGWMTVNDCKTEKKE